MKVQAPLPTSVSNSFRVQQASFTHILKLVLWRHWMHMLPMTSGNQWELCNYFIITITVLLKIEYWASGVMFDQPSSMLTGKDVVSHLSSVVFANMLFFLLFWLLEIYAFPLCCSHLRGDNDFGSRVAGESCGRPWLVMGAAAERGLEV